MLRNCGHSRPIAFDEDSKLVLVETGHPFEAAPEFENDEQREGARKAAGWLLELLGPKATIAKLCALRFSFQLENRPMQAVALEFGITRAAISKWRAIYCIKFGLPLGKSVKARRNFAQAQKTAWKTRRATNGSKP